MTASLEYVASAIAALVMVKEAQRAGATSGVITCPKCGEKIYWSSAARKGKELGHSSGQCETANCLNWIE